MFFAIDVGNSNIVWSAWDGAQWHESYRFDTQAGDYKDRLHAWLKKAELDRQAITSVMISSVVPDITRQLQQVITELLEVEPVLLNAKTDTGITLGADKPERVGADLIADAVGAYALVEDDCIVVDFGTATTVMAVEKPGVLSGVAICTGLNVSIEALVSKAAQLEDIPLEVPDSPLGKNTVAAMQSGLILGHICMVERLIERIQQEIGPAAVVATGGLVTLLAPHTDSFNFVEPLLTLDGLRLTAKRLSEKQEAKSKK